MQVNVIFKKLIALVILAILLISFSVTAFADFDSEDFYEGIITDLTENLDEEAKQMLAALGFDEYSADELSSLSLQNVLSVIFGSVKENIRKPVSFLCINTVMLIFCILAKGLLSEKLRTGGYFESVVVIFIGLYSYSEIAALISDTLAVIKATAFLMKLLIPILAVIVTFSGNAVLAVSSSAVSVYISQAVVAVCNDFLTTLLCVLSAASVCASVSGTIHIAPVTELAKKVFNIVLGFLGTVYSGVLTIRDVMAASIDKISFKGIKFVLGSAVPIIGSALSEGLSAIVSAVSLFKNTFGIIGIIIALITVLPVVSRLILWILILFIAEYASTVFGNDKISSIYESLRYVITMLLTLVFFIVFVFLISVSTILIISKS